MRPDFCQFQNVFVKERVLNMLNKSYVSSILYFTFGTQLNTKASFTVKMSSE